MKAISRFTRAIEWIARHDAAATTPEQLATSMTYVALVAHVFDKDPARVAELVLEERRRRRAPGEHAYPLPGDAPAFVLFTGA